MSVTGSIMAATGLAGAGISAYGASKAASTQAGAAEQAAQLQHQDAQAALDFQKQQYGNSLSMLYPYLNTGYGALSLLRTGLGIPGELPQGFTMNPNGTAAGLNPGNFGNGGMSTSLFPGGFGIGGNNPLATNPELGANGIGGGQRFFPMLSGVNDGTGTIGTMAGLRSFGGGLNNAGIGPSGGGVATATTNQGGTGQVPMTGGFITNPDAHNFGQGAPAGGATGGNPNIGFGSLLSPFSEQFQAPTNVTEQNDPGYQFRLQTGLDEMTNSAAARGGLLSGGTAKAMQDYAQNSASNEYVNVYNRDLNEYLNRANLFFTNQSNQFNKLADIAGMGQATGGQLTNAGLTAGNQIGNTLLTSGAQIGQNINNAGAARASGYVGASNAIGGSLSNLGNLAMLYKFLGSGGGGSSSLFGPGV